MINQNNLKIFSVYYKPEIIFQSDIIIPIQAGTEISEYQLDMLKDNDGENISDRNKHYGELTAWYWVWKNYMKQNPNIEFIGFCHYRRFLDISQKPTKKAFKKIHIDEVQKVFDKYPDCMKNIEGYDIILPGLRGLRGKTTFSEYLDEHPQKDWDELLNIVQEKYPEYLPFAENVFNAKKQYHCLNFIMRRDIFENFMQWSFDLLFELEKRIDWTEYTTYATIRSPAFLIERFFNLWLEYHKKTNDIKIKEVKGCLIVKEKKHPWYKRMLGIE